MVHLWKSSNAARADRWSIATVARADDAASSDADEYGEDSSSNWAVVVTVDHWLPRDWAWENRRGYREDDRKQDDEDSETR